MRADEAHLVGFGGYRAGRHGRSGEGQDAFRSVAHGRERVDAVSYTHLVECFSLL